MATVGAAKAMRFSWGGVMTALSVGLFLAVVALMLSFSWPAMARHGDKQWAYWLHITGGTVVMLLGPFQFIAPIRNRFRRYHRVAGYVFVSGSVAAFVGFWSVQPTATDVFFLSQATAMSLWMVAVAAAIVAARRKRFLTHQHNMTRAFVLAAYFVVVRQMDRFGMDWVGLFASDKAAANAHSDWLSWVIPIVLVEVYYGRKWDRLLKRRGATA
ncbi:MAG: DUF2306 domain-containing protein [Sphingomicrobium sp.]